MDIDRENRRPVGIAWRERAILRPTPLERGGIMQDNENPKDFYRVFAPGVPNVRDISERLTEAEARSRKRQILMAYPAATVRIEKTDESGRGK